jgi:hypothetical protein
MPCGTPTHDPHAIKRPISAAVTGSKNAAVFRTCSACRNSYVLAECGLNLRERTKRAEIGGAEIERFSALTRRVRSQASGARFLLVSVGTAEHNSCRRIEDGYRLRAIRRTFSINKRGSRPSRKERELFWRVERFPSNQSFNVAISCCTASKSTGLTRCASKPASLESRRSPSWPQPVWATSSTPLRSGVCRMRRATS